MSSYDSLTEDQRRFVDEYVEGAVSAEEALELANFAPFEGFTPHQVVQRLLASPKIQKAIEERQKVVHDQGVANQLWYLRRLVDYLNTDYSEIFHPGSEGAPRHPRHWPKALRMMIRSVDTDPLTGAIKKIQFEPKTKIYEMVGRMNLVGAFSNENDAGKVVVNIVRDYTQRLEANDEKLVEDIRKQDPELLIQDAHD